MKMIKIRMRLKDDGEVVNLVGFDKLEEAVADTVPFRKVTIN